MIGHPVRCLRIAAALSSYASVSMATTDVMWTAKASMSAYRGGLAAVALSGSIYAIGGSGLATMEAYDPSTNSWTLKTPMSAGRNRPGACVANGKIYVFSGDASYALVEEYDPVQDKWTTKTGIPTPRTDPEAAFANGKIYVICGYFSGVCALSTVEEYDPVMDTWATKASLPPDPIYGRPEREGAGACVIGGKVYHYGGWPCGGFPGLNTVNVYDPVGDVWSGSTASYMPMATYLFATAEVAGRICVIASYPGPSSRVMEYDSSANTWSIKSDYPVDVADAAGASLNGKIYVADGWSLYEGEINNSPVLAWTGEPGFVGRGVNPPLAGKDGTFEFRIQYSDVDGDQPMSGYPKVHIRKGGNEIPGSPFVMTCVAGSYVSGATYRASTAIGPVGGDYVISFEAKDEHGLAAEGAPTGSLMGPEIGGGLGSLVVAPNAIGRAGGPSHIHLHLTGRPNAKVEVSVCNSDGTIVGRFRRPLDEHGYDEFEYEPKGEKGDLLPPGLYWIVAKGGGVDDKKGFAVVRGR